MGRLLHRYAYDMHVHLVYCCRYCCNIEALEASQGSERDGHLSSNMGIRSKVEMKKTTLQVYMRKWKHFSLEEDTWKLKDTMKEAYIFLF